ncbi:flavodoxin domain-containing protein [Butyrivibrio sp. AC2005]|uniref:flavodoxin domain-containing protein n=1 Tax=Butyrivibrio sp. AC2005 TaxID=1280672 RepID=UPI0018CB924F|nr:flavodoxin domain-containing protein [Butyrivibrio sp. AC2005]
MKTLVIYTSQTGFTKRYAQWLADRVGADLIDLKEAQKKGTDYFEAYGAICYGGWAMAEKVVKSKWFLLNDDFRGFFATLINLKVWIRFS